MRGMTHLFVLVQMFNLTVQSEDLLQVPIGLQQAQGRLLVFLHLQPTTSLVQLIFQQEA